jgi:hypothetical protein
MEPTGDSDGPRGARSWAGAEGGARAGIGVTGAATGRRGMLLGGGPVTFGGTGGSGEFIGLAMAAMAVSLARSVGGALFGGGSGGSGPWGCGRGGAFSATIGASVRSRSDSNSKVGKAGGAGRAFEKRERPDLGGCRVAMSAVDPVSPAE